eukprot:580145-Amorphochlora_amoeboformis.AAC.1
MARDHDGGRCLTDGESGRCFRLQETLSYQQVLGFQTPVDGEFPAPTLVGTARLFPLVNAEEDVGIVT